jgi:hypothetical protein
LRNIYEFNLARFNPKVMAERVADTYKVWCSFIDNR